MTAPRLLVLDVARADALHLATALELHAKTCRANGLALPAGLVALAARCWELARGDCDRQEATLLDALAEMAQGRRMQRLLLTTAEVAGILGLSERQVERLIAANEIASVKVGNSRRVHEADLSDYASSLRRSRSFADRVEHKVVTHHDSGRSSSDVVVGAKSFAGATGPPPVGPGGRTGGRAE